MLGSGRLTLAGCLCAIFAGTFPLCAAAQRGDPAPPPDKSAPDRADVFTDSVKATPQQMRQVSFELLDLAEMFHEVLEIPISETQAEALRFARELILATSDEDYAPLLSSYPIWEQARDEIVEQLFGLVELIHAEELERLSSSYSPIAVVGGSATKDCPLTDPKNLYTGSFSGGSISDGAVFVAILATKISDAAIAAVGRICDQILVVLGSGGNVSLPCVAFEVARSLFASIMAGIEEHNDAILAHDVVAIHRNVKALECLINHCTPVEDLTRRGYGCNGNDDNCDLSVDECDEDMFHPEIIVDPSVTRLWYPSKEAGAKAVLGATRYVDDCGQACIKCAENEDGVDVDDCGFDCVVCDQDNESCGPVVTRDGCKFTLTQTARDTCGNETQLSTVFKVDSVPPTISFPDNLPDCFPSADAAEDSVLNDLPAIIQDTCTSDSELLVEFSSRVTHCNLRVTLAVTDLAGNKFVESQSMTVDEENPRVSIDPLRVSFDATNTSPICFPDKAAAEAAVTAATRVTDNCTDTPTPSIACVGPTPDTCNYECTAEALDTCDQKGVDTIRLRVDNTPPTITCWFGTDENVKTIVPPSKDNKMFDPAFKFKVIDDCTDAICTDCDTSISVTSDEPTTGSGLGTPSFPDASVLDDGFNQPIVLVRAEVAGGEENDGRVYQITVNSTDSCGNRGTATCHVNVPKGNNTTATDSGQVYDATVEN